MNTSTLIRCFFPPSQPKPKKKKKKKVQEEIQIAMVNSKRLLQFKMETHWFGLGGLGMGWEK